MLRNVLSGKLKTINDDRCSNCKNEGNNMGKTYATARKNHSDNNNQGIYNTIKIVVASYNKTVNVESLIEVKGKRQRSRQRYM